MKDLYTKLSCILLVVSCATKQKEGINALIMVPRNLGANYYLITDVIEEYGWNVTQVGVLDTVTPCPWFAAHGEVFPVIPDLRPEDISNVTDYDCLIIAPSTGNAAPDPNSNSDLLESKEALMLVKRAAYFNVPLWATCAGVRVLAAADVVRDKFIVGSPRFRSEYIAAGANYVGRPQSDNPPTIDGNIITCARGQYYNYANVMAVATAIENNQTRGGRRNSEASYIVASDIDFADGDVMWAKTYGGSGSDGGRAFCRTPEGGYLITGYTFAPGVGDADMLAVKADRNGDIIWSKRFGGTGTEYGNACIPVDDGYLILGYTTSFGAGSKDFYLVKLDEDGNELWTKTYGGVSWDVGTALCPNGKGGYFLCGYTHSFGWGEEDIYLVNIDREGTEIWSKTYGGFRIDMANSIHSASDGGCVIGASSGSYSANTDFFITKVSAGGETEWVQTYGAPGEHGHGFDWCKNSIPLSDGGYCMTGYSDCNDMMDVVVIKTDAFGNEQWLKSFGNRPFYEYGNAVCETENGYIVAGITKSMVKPAPGKKRIYNNDIYLVKLAENGDIIWQKVIGSPNTEWANAIAVDENGALMVLGHTDAGISGSLDVCMLKIPSR
jgi:hypothetical protein